MSLIDEIETLRERRANARVWAAAALREGMNMALTLNPDRYCATRREAETYIRTKSNAFFRELDRRLRGASRRSAAQETGLSLLGVCELLDRRGTIYPHAHLAIKLDADECCVAETLLHERWSLRFANGEDGEGGKRYRFDSPYGSPICNHSGSRPEWELTPIHDHEGWMRYIAKQTDETTDIMLPRQFLSEHC